MIVRGLSALVALWFTACSPPSPLPPLSGPGAVLTFELDPIKITAPTLETAAEIMANALRDAHPAIRVDGQGVLEDTARIHLVSAADAPQAQSITSSALNREGDAQFAVTIAGNFIEARLTQAGLDTQMDRAMDESLMILAHRLDPSGARNIRIRREANWRIVIEAVGANPEAFSAEAQPATSIAFHMVDTRLDQEFLAPGEVPPGRRIAEPFPGANVSPEVVLTRQILGGEHIADASPFYDSGNGWVVTVSLDRTGAALFCRATTDNIGGRLALLVNEQVVTAPAIVEPICDGNLRISGNFTPESANELAILMKSAPIPARLIAANTAIIAPPNER